MCALILLNFSFCLDTFTLVSLYSFCHLSFLSFFFLVSLFTFISFVCGIGEGVPHFWCRFLNNTWSLHSVVTPSISSWMEIFRLIWFSSKLRLILTDSRPESLFKMTFNDRFWICKYAPVFLCFMSQSFCFNFLISYFFIQWVNFSNSCPSHFGRYVTSLPQTNILLE